MVNRKILNNVLRNVVSGKEEVPSGIGTPGSTPPAGAPQSTDPTIPGDNTPKFQIQDKRFYSYDAPAAMSINFPGLSSLIKSAPQYRDPIIEKLKGNGYYPAYFRWKKILISTNRYSKDQEVVVVYECELDQDGRKLAGKERIYPNNAPVDIPTFESDLGVFRVVGSEKYINLDTSSDSVYAAIDFNDNTIRLLLNKTPIKGNNFEAFKGLFDNYRVRATVGTFQELRNPDFERSRNDGVPGGYYPGGQAAFEKLVGPVLQEMEKKEEPEEPSLKDKSNMEGSPEKKSPFEPVDEQKPEKVKGDQIDNPTGSPMNKRFSSENMRRMARRVLAGYISEDASSEEEASVTTTGTGKVMDDITKNLYEQSAEHTDTGKKLKTVADQIARAQKARKTTGIL